MRNISEEIKNSIVNVFPKDNTIAVIIFGSYGTNRQTCHSDIDIAWIPKKKVPITQLAVKSEDLRKVLDVDVDLKIVTDNSGSVVAKLTTVAPIITSGIFVILLNIIALLTRKFPLKMIITKPINILKQIFNKSITCPFQNI